MFGICVMLQVDFKNFIEVEVINVKNVQNEFMMFNLEFIVLMKFFYLWWSFGIFFGQDEVRDY